MKLTTTTESALDGSMYTHASSSVMGAVGGGIPGFSFSPSSRLTDPHSFARNVGRGQIGTSSTVISRVLNFPG